MMNVQPLPAILQPRLPGSTIEETLTLETVRELNINNTKAIGLLDSKGRWTSITSFGLTSIVIISIIMMLEKRGQQTKSREIITTIPSVHMSLPEISTTNFMETRQTPGLSQIPYF